MDDRLLPKFTTPSTSGEIKMNIEIKTKIVRLEDMPDDITYKAILTIKQDTRLLHKEYFFAKSGIAAENLARRYIAESNIAQVISTLLV